MVTSSYICSVCKTVFEKSTYPSDPTPQICSRKCHSVLMRNARQYKTAMITLTCAQCNSSFTKEKAKHKRSLWAGSQNHFCSRTCTGKWTSEHKHYGINRSKLEVWLESQLRILYADLTLLVCERNEINAELDFFFPDLKLAFELNGVFHYEPIFGSQRLERTQENDKRKWQACLERGIELCVVDSSTYKYHKPALAQRFLDIFIKVIDMKLETMKAHNC